jgi:hypothetical protein
MKFIDNMRSEYADIMRRLDAGAALDDTLNEQIVDAAEKFRNEYIA